MKSKKEISDKVKEIITTPLGQISDPIITISHLEMFKWAIDKTENEIKARLKEMIPMIDGTSPTDTWGSKCSALEWVLK